MTFTVSDFHTLVEMAYKHPEWRAELRQLVLTEEILSLPQVVRELAEAQKELAEAQRELAAAQVRTEQRVEELAEAQKRSEDRLSRVEAAVEKLAIAQARTETELRNLSNRVGSTEEEEAEGVLRVVLEAKGYRLVGEPFNLRMDGDVDVVLPLEDADGAPVWALAEAKVRLGWRGVEAWAHRMRSEDFRARLAREGVVGPYLVYVYGMRVDAAARPAAEKHGIGVLSSQGEQLAPAGLIAA